MFEACANERLKCLTVVDECTRECLAIDVASPIRTHRAIEVLCLLVHIYGAPRYICSDNGPDL